eukprot:2086938-Rhodomonas_salina.1
MRGSSVAVEGQVVEPSRTLSVDVQTYCLCYTGTTGLDAGGVSRKVVDVRFTHAAIRRGFATLQSYSGDLFCFD